jgi:hypothetical protein
MTTQQDKIGEAAAKQAADEARALLNAPPEYPNLAAALAAFQSQRPDLEKTATADVVKEGRKLYSYGYATLADVEKAVLPGLGAVGLSWTCHTTLHENRFVLVCILQHPSGEAIQSVFPLKDSDDPQALGSKLTYWRRYALMLATGVSPESDDDDGASAQAAAASGRQQPRAEEPRQQTRQERPSPGDGTRQGAADRYARELLTAPLDRLADVWRNVEAGGHPADKPTADGTKAIRDHLAGAEIPADSEPGRFLAWATGPLAQIAGFRLLLDGWQAQQVGAAHRAAEVDKTYMALAQLQSNFGRIQITGGKRLGDWLALNAAALHSAQASQQQAMDPPWDTSGDGNAYDGDDANDNDPGRPAVLEG